MDWRDPERIDQTELGAGGNCYGACLAMLLRVPLSEVPSFNRLSNDLPGRRELEVSWIIRQGWIVWGAWSPEVVMQQDGVINLRLHFGNRMRATHFPWPPALGFYIASGVSPRNIRHSVVYKNGALWHDPHPDKAGLVVMDYVDFLRPLYPAGLQKIV